MGNLILLKKKSDFEQFRRSRLYVGRLIRMRLRFYGLNQNSPRFGFIVPKKVVARVVDRNRIKRQLKGFLTTNLQHLVPMDFLFFPQAGILLVKPVVFRAELIKLIKQAGAWRENE